MGIINGDNLALPQSAAASLFRSDNVVDMEPDNEKEDYGSNFAEFLMNMQRRIGRNDAELKLIVLNGMLRQLRE